MGRQRKRVPPGRENSRSTRPPAQSGRKGSVVPTSSSAPVKEMEEKTGGGEAMPVRSSGAKEEGPDAMLLLGRSRDVAKRMCLRPGFSYSLRRRGAPRAGGDAGGLPEQNGLDGESSVSKHDLGGRGDQNANLPGQNTSMDSAPGVGGKESGMELGGLPDHCGNARGRSSDQNGEKQLSSDETRRQQPRRSLRCAKIKRETPGDVYGLKSLVGKESEMKLGGLPDHCGNTRERSSDENGEKQLSSDEARLKQPRRSLRCAKIKRETPGDVYGLKSEADPCPICLRQMKGRVGTIETCAHAFCLPCIMEWSKANNSCPKDRIQYSEILAHHHSGEPVYKRIPVEKTIPEDYPESDSSSESGLFPPSNSSEFEDSDENDDDEPEWILCEHCGARNYPSRFSC